MDFGKLLKACWEDFMKDIVQLILFGLVGTVLCLTIVLIPTVAGGWTRGFLAYVREGKRPEFNLLWNFEGYLQLLLLMIVEFILLAIGYSLLVIPGVILTVLWLYSLFFMVDRNLGFWDSMMGSAREVWKDGFSSFINHFVILLIVGVLNTLGGCLWGLGTLVTMPFGMLLLSHVYRDMPGRVSR